MSVVALPQLAAVRRTRGVAQAALADTCGLPVGRIRSAEAGRPVDRDDAHLLADALVVGLAALAGWTNVTVATKFPEFGYSLNRNSTVLHRTEKVRLVWRHGNVVRVEADWECHPGLGTDNAALTDDPGAMRWCGQCDMERVQTAPRMVYAGIAPDGLLKVGCTMNLPARLTAQGLDLIDAVPGSFPEETDLVRHLRAVTAPARGREWFPATDAVLAAAADWLVARKAVAA